jgi:adenylate cyclase
MIFKCKNRKLIKIVLLLEAILLPGTLMFWVMLGTVWTRFDFQILDFFYAQAVQRGYGLPRSSEIVYITITDDSYAKFGTHLLDRMEMARVNEVLAQLGPSVVAYDLIFPLPMTPAADQRFADSIEQLGAAYLPIAPGELTATPQPFQWGSGLAYERLRSEQLRQPREQGKAQPFYSTRALMQFDAFAEAAFNTGHIGASQDVDGVFRHLPLLVKIDTAYLPSMALSMFLDTVKVPWEAVTVHWGHTMTIPALPGSTLTRDVVMPIDAQGRVFVPYAQPWGYDFPNMAMHNLLQLFDAPDLRGNLQDFFENKFVFIGDVSTGIADAGQTPLDRYAPLVMMHAALMNGLLTHTFYQQWSFWDVLALVCLIGILVGLAAVAQSSIVLYATGAIIFVGLLVLTGIELVHFTLFPVVSVFNSFIVIFIGIVIGLQVAIAKDQAFIRNTFAKYVSEKVVNELLQHPELLHLGGEERIVSVLFSDIENFTTLSERLSPRELVSLLNSYLTEMTAIVLEQGGIIDKYIGDGIMAEFGAPIPVPHHADQAVRTALHMQRRLEELRPQWRQQGLPELRCRVGINTGTMIVGNIGSEQVFNYTVIGDPVNLAARLEGANKYYQTLVMISEFTHDCLTPNLFRTRLLDAIRVKGRLQPVKVYEVYGESTDGIVTDDLKYYHAYDEACAAYLERRFDVARAQFEVALAIRPTDIAAREMLERMADLDPEALPDDWDGVKTFETK